MNWLDFWQAFEDAKRTMAQADDVAEQMAYILCGRLRKCESRILKKFKRELRAFNISTGRWNDVP